jgi:uncharacterized protein (TIGR03435 family)
MRVGVVLVVSFCFIGPALSLPAQSVGVAAKAPGDIGGDWQVAYGGDRDGTRVVFRITKAPAGWRSMVYWVDQSHYPASIPVVLWRGDTVSFTASAHDLNGSFTGAMSEDHSSISGQWTQAKGDSSGFASQTLTLTRAVPGKAWVIPPPLGSDAKIMAADLDPSFEVATVKPHDPKVMGGGWRWIGARRFEATMPVGALLADIYGLQRDQIVGGPEWLFKDDYDYAGVPDLPGWPTADQRYSMERKMLQERFNLKVHSEKREMSGLMLTVEKSGSRMAPSIMVDPGVTFGMHPAAGGGGLTFTAQNSSMGDFKRALQNMQDRPVVDRTGLHGQFDFDLTFLPDETMFGGRVHLPPADSGEQAAGLYRAMQEQLGLKLSPFKGMVEVLIIDHIDSPSPN